MDHKVISHFMSLQSDHSEGILKNALNDWYKQDAKKYEGWSSRKYPASSTEIKSDMLFKRIRPVK